MKRILVMIAIFLAIVFIAATQKGIVFQAAQPHKIPNKVDTLRCILIVSDTQTRYSRGIGVYNFYSKNIFQIYGYMRIGGKQWYPEFLNMYKKPLPKELIVWNSIIIE